MEKLHRNDLGLEAQPAVEAARPKAMAGEADQAAAVRQSEVQLRALAGDAVVQARGATGPDSQVRAAAGRGIAGSAAPLPYLDQIQRSFGSYDVGAVQAHTGDAAAEACDDMGAAAFAAGNHVAFGAAPDLHTAAHEAAHVVQQRGGVHFAGGVGREGDDYERHADAVADAVVAGESAEELLAERAPAPGQAGAGEGVQMRRKKRELPSGDEAFDEMWEAHPHNYLEEDEADQGENISSEDLLDEQGLPEWLKNGTCAIRLSVMFNTIGEKITKAKLNGAGAKGKYSKKTRWWYIRTARDMAKYLTTYYRGPDEVWPKKGKFDSAEEFDTEFESTIKPIIQGRKGIVFFDKLHSDYPGTGHVDLFDGEALSDAPGWYACHRLKVWYVSVP